MNLKKMAIRTALISSTALAILLSPITAGGPLGVPSSMVAQADRKSVV